MITWDVQNVCQESMGATLQKFFRRDHLGRTALHVVITCWPSILTIKPKPDSKLKTAVINAQRKAEACLQLLWDHGADINAQVEGESWATALHLSVRYAVPSAVQILASYGADVNAVDSSGMTPLHMAAGILHTDITAILIRQGADINKGVKSTGRTPLHLAAVATAMKSTETLECDFSCISELLQHGADPNAESKTRMTPLHEVCSMGNEALVDLLLRFGANINKLSQEKENCLFLFLNHRCNIRRISLLVKLLSITSPLTVYNQNGHLPFTLTLPCYFKQRDQLLELIWQPRRLQDICKRDIYLRHVQGKERELKQSLPQKLYDFVFNHWENIHNIYFENDHEQTGSDITSR
ncbi:ankyrin repeat domain-containing protein 61 isoform X2 [Echeneis naucrates]|uniref:ankyrin repeat domain-containing protein 61 isoform X2 n=1 Tax=Echeneis naucrates TaxID=173247 RepID=UPI0011143FE1|nr:ankyrin repeat domain-containing protein 61 isoform X2 [Echeneis naucrates]